MLNLCKDHHIVAKQSTTPVGNEWPLSNALWIKFHNTNGKYKPELDEYFNMYRCQLNFALFSATSTLGISRQSLIYPNLLVRAVYQFHVYFHVRLILHDLDVPLPYGGGFCKARNVFF